MEALVEVMHLKKWWGISSAYIEKRDNGLYTLTWQATDKGIKYISTGRIYLYNKTKNIWSNPIPYIKLNTRIMKALHEG